MLAYWIVRWLAAVSRKQLIDLLPSLRFQFVVVLEPLKTLYCTNRAVWLLTSNYPEKVDGHRVTVAVVKSNAVQQSDTLNNYCVLHVG
jgi:hypothetical protein